MKSKRKRFVVLYIIMVIMGSSLIVTGVKDVAKKYNASRNLEGVKGYNKESKTIMAHRINENKLGFYLKNSFEDTKKYKIVAYGQYNLLESSIWSFVKEISIKSNERVLIEIYIYQITEINCITIYEEKGPKAIIESFFVRIPKDYLYIVDDSVPIILISPDI